MEVMKILIHLHFENLKRRRKFEDPGINGRVIFKCILKIGYENGG
jgi:hypothetical protein